MRRLLPERAAGPEPASGTGTGLDDDALFDAYAYPGVGVTVRANMVASLDGAASADGKSRGLSSPSDKRVFRVLRGLADLILVGAGTARAERYAAVRPEETFPERRAAAGQAATPAIAVVSGRLDIDPDSALFRGPAPTVVVTHEAADRVRRRRLEQVTDVVVAGTDRVDVAAAVDALARRGYSRILCEGGPGLLRDVAATGCLDELCLTLSPRLLAGDAARILHGPALEGADALRLTDVLEEDGNLFLRYAR